MEGLGQGAAPSPCSRQEAPIQLEGAGCRGSLLQPSGPSHGHKAVPVSPGCTPRAHRGRVGASPLLCASGRQHWLFRVEEGENRGVWTQGYSCSTGNVLECAGMSPTGAPHQLRMCQGTAAPLQPPAPPKGSQCFGHCAGDHFPVPDHAAKPTANHFQNYLLCGHVTEGSKGPAAEPTAPLACSEPFAQKIQDSLFTESTQILPLISISCFILWFCKNKR